jgi:hypothetical protein
MTHQLGQEELRTNSLGTFLTQLKEADGIVSGQLEVPEHFEDYINHSDQSPSSVLVDHHISQLEPRSSLAHTAARVEMSVWGRMPKWAKILSYITFGIFYGIWWCCCQCCIPDVDEKKPGMVIGHAASLHDPLLRQKDVDLAAHDVEVEPIPNYLIFDRLQHQRDEAQEHLREARETMACEVGILDEFVQTLEPLSQGSGKTFKDFMEAIRSGTSYEDLGLKYYRFRKGVDEIPNRHKEAIKSIYAQALVCQQRINGLKRDISSQTEKIRADFYSSPLFKGMVEEGIPYGLYIEGTYFQQDDFFARGGRFQNFPSTRARLNVQLAHWAKGEGSIQLNMTDPAFMAQHYLFHLSRPEMMTLSRDQALELRKANLNLEMRRGHKVYLEKDGPVPVIRSERIIDLKNARGEVEKTYRWTEIIRITPRVGRDCEVRITKNVQELK